MKTFSQVVLSRIVASAFSLHQKHVTPKRITSPYMFRTMLGFLADAAVQAESWKIILPKYGIRDSKAKNFELAALIHV